MPVRALLLSSLAGATATTLLGQPAAPRPEHDVTAQEVVYRIPGMAEVTVRKDVVYKKGDGVDLKLDVYAPTTVARGGSRLPAVVFVNGVGDRPGSRLKEWGIYQSWGRLIGAWGWMAVTFDARSGDRARSDIRDLLAYLRAEGVRLGIDPDRVAIWVCSGNVTPALPLLMDESPAGVIGAVVYYGSGEPTRIRTDLPVYSARAGRDGKRLNAAIDQLWQRAVEAGAPWTMVSAASSHHAFDALDETDESRRIVRETLEFYRDLFSPPAAPGSPSEARKALAHWFAREYSDAAAAYTTYVRSHPDDAVAWMRLGLSQAHERSPEAEASLEKAVALGAASPAETYNVACGYALLGRKEKALDWLERALRAGTFERRMVESDDDLASLHGEPRFDALLEKLR
jgi:dienelactone hydrolase